MGAKVNGINVAIQKPIIVFGTGRCGSTIFTSMLSTHPQVAWLSGFCDFYPDKPWINRLLMHSLDYRVVRHLMHLRAVQKKINASECYGFWDHHCHGFSTPHRDLLPTDVTVKNEQDIHAVLSRMTTRRRRRFLLKVTGWPRVGFLSKVFPDARFIRIIRDGRAVANSLMNMDFWWGWRGPQNWRWGSLSPAHTEEWNRYKQSFVVLAGIQWKLTMDAAERAKRFLHPRDLLEIRYEDLCESPVEMFREVARFAELDWSPVFEQELRRFHLTNRNPRWEVELTETQQRELNEVLRDYLLRYGYLNGQPPRSPLALGRRVESVPQP